MGRVEICSHKLLKSHDRQNGKRRCSVNVIRLHYNWIKVWLALKRLHSLFIQKKVKDLTRLSDEQLEY
jgi:hypothetical protein